MKTYEKHPLATLDYGFDLTEWLAEGEEVTGVIPVKEFGDVVLGTSVFDTRQGAVFISGGTDTVKSLVRLAISTSGGRVFVGWVMIYVTNKIVLI